MAVKNYLINDKWLDIDKQNIVEVKSTDGVIGSIKLNGEEYGGSGGGGSSDFSTAEVTIVAESEYVDGLTINYVTNSGMQITNSPDVGTFQTVLYKGVGHAYMFESLHANIVVTGNAVYDSMLGEITITGDCTITIS